MDVCTLELFTIMLFYLSGNGNSGRIEFEPLPRGRNCDSTILLFLCQGRMLFCAFVDYSKAFDSINRATQWKKLISYGISGKMKMSVTCRGI